MGVTGLYESRECRIGRVDSLLVSVWEGASSVELLDVLAKHEQDVVDQFGEVSVLFIFTGTPKGAAAGVKERGDELAQRFKPYVKANVVLVLAKGLSGIIVRSFLAAFSLISPLSIESASSLEDAVKRVQGFPNQRAELKGDTQLLQKLHTFVEARPSTK